jgi:hypothetical protein
VFDRVLAVCTWWASLADGVADWFARRRAATAALASVWVVLTSGVWIWLAAGPLLALFQMGERRVDSAMLARASSAARALERGEGRGRARADGRGQDRGAGSATGHVRAQGNARSEAEKRLAEYSAPRRGSIRNGPVYAAVVLILFAIALPRPSVALAAAVGIAVAIACAALIVGWRLDYVVFRPDATTPWAVTAAEPLDVGERIQARAAGRLLTRDMVFEVTANNAATQHVATIRADEIAFHVPIRFRLEPIAVASMPAASAASSYGRPPRPAELVMLGTRREIGLAMSAPNLGGLVTGTLTLVRGERPAMRLRTVSGPVVLAFDSAADRDRAAGAIRESLAS